MRFSAPTIYENKWHILSSNSTEYTMSLLLQYLYPDKIINFDQDSIYIVDDGWSMHNPYTGQIQNKNWNKIDSNSLLSPYFGYWVKINSIYDIIKLNRETEIYIDNSKNFIFNYNSDYIQYNSIVKYGIIFGEYVIKNVPQDHPISIVVPNCINHQSNIYINYFGQSEANFISTTAYKTHSYYYGDVHINIKRPFTDYISIHCAVHGYMNNGEDILTYHY